MPRTIINVTHLVAFSWKTLRGMTMCIFYWDILLSMFICEVIVYCTIQSLGYKNLTAGVNDTTILSVSPCTQEYIVTMCSF